MNMGWALDLLVIMFWCGYLMTRIGVLIYRGLEYFRYVHSVARQVADPQRTFTSGNKVVVVCEYRRYYGQLKKEWDVLWKSVVWGVVVLGLIELLRLMLGRL